MFVNSTNVGFAQRVVATLVACAVVLWSVGAYNTAQAANLTQISDTLSDSDLSVTSSHTIEFDMPAGGAGLLGTDDIVITWDSQDDGAGGQDFGGIAAIVDNSDLLFQVNAGGPAAPTYVSSDGNSITIDGIAASAGDTVEIVVATGVITNPAVAASFEIEVSLANTDTDLGRTRVAIVENVLVSATVQTVFDFTITGKATSTPVNGTSTTGSTSPTAIPFGILVAGEIKTMAQQLNVSTNAANGFVVTVQQDGDLESATGATIDSFIDGADTNTPVVWAAPGGTLGNVNEYGHWGITSEDDLNTSEFSGTKFVAASTTARAIFSHTAVADGTTTHIGSTTVGYQIEITPLQEAADDYNTTLTYIATPTF